jgi:hypothetical protein
VGETLLRGGWVHLWPTLRGRSRRLVKGDVEIRNRKTRDHSTLCFSTQKATELLRVCVCVHLSRRRPLVPVAR